MGQHCGCDQLLCGASGRILSNTGTCISLILIPCISNVHGWQAYEEKIRNVTLNALNAKVRAFKVSHPNFSGRISLLAHSLGRLAATAKCLAPLQHQFMLGLASNFSLTACILLAYLYSLVPFLFLIKVLLMCLSSIRANCSPICLQLFTLIPDCLHANPYLFRVLLFTLLVSSFFSIISYDIIDKALDQLDFKPEGLFCIGSPVPLILTIRGVTAEQVNPKHKSSFHPLWQTFTSDLPLIAR